jgi:cyanate permease
MTNRVTEPNASFLASLEKTFADRWEAVLLFAGLVAISLNQRPALVAVGP